MPTKPPTNQLAWWMDQCFRVPGTPIRFGFDALLGLVPGLGDWVTNVVQAYFVVSLVAQKNIPPVIALRMILNVAIDGTLGAIPLVGDVFDVFFKANTRNLRLFENVQNTLQQGKPVATTGHWVFVAAVLVVLGGVVACTAFLAYTALNYLVSLTNWNFA